MGVAVHYRGSVADLDRVEDFEDRVLDLALNLGGEARIWRSMAADQPGRIVRGVTLDLYPGQETISLLISPEGWLINLLEIEAAEQGELREPSWCFVKTQFGAIEGHAVLVELLVALKQHFIPDLEILDEGGYWPNRDVATLRRKVERVQAAIEGLAESLRNYGLSSEAAEDPEILASRIERVAAIVHRTLSQPVEHPPFAYGDEAEYSEAEYSEAAYDDDAYDDAGGDDAGGDEQDWDAVHRANRRRQERLHRAIRERLVQGEDPRTALRSALRDVGLPDLAEELAGQGDEDDVFLDEFDDDDEHAPWRESLLDAARDEEDVEMRIDWHPLQKQSQDLTVRLFRLFVLPDDQRNAHVELLHRGAGDLMGGLVQALGSEDWRPPPQVAVPHLKRALRGAAYAQGALFSLRAEGLVGEAIFAELRAALQTLEHGTLDELRRLRDAAEE
jgi:hypothetical protein